MSQKASARGSVARTAAIAEVVRSFHRLFKGVDTFSKYSLRAFGVTGPQLWALRVIEEGRELTIGDLSDRMHLHISTVSGILDRLEKGRFVTRQRSASDRRVVLLKVTARGKAILARAPEPPRSRLARRLPRLSSGEIRKLLGGLHRLLDLIEIDRIEISLPPAGRRPRALPT